MTFVKVGTENRADIGIHHNDRGAGRPIVLIDGYPLDGNSWEREHGPHSICWPHPEVANYALLDCGGR